MAKATIYTNKRHIATLDVDVKLPSVVFSLAVSTSNAVSSLEVAILSNVFCCMSLSERAITYYLMVSDKIMASAAKPMKKTAQPIFLFFDILIVLLFYFLFDFRVHLFAFANHQYLM